VILVLDGDVAGERATRAAIDAALSVADAPDVWVARIAGAPDADALMRSYGIAAWRELVAEPTPAVEWRLGELLGSSDSALASSKPRETLSAGLRLSRRATTSSRCGSQPDRSPARCRHACTETYVPRAALVRRARYLPWPLENA
jgi:DNA primase